MSKLNVTRGYGFLEGFLTKQRAKIADRLIPSSHRKGRILDIGCGRYPFFLLNTEFFGKYGLDKTVAEGYEREFQGENITFLNYDIGRKDVIPFDNGYFDVVTMLAVFEHIEPKNSRRISSEIYRVLKPGGVYIMTTPAVWTGPLLRIMARLRLVSPIEIGEHKNFCSLSQISSILQEANFSKEKLRFGYFEMFINRWTKATK